MSPSRKTSQPGAPGERAASAGAPQPFAPARRLLREYALAWADHALRGRVLRAGGEDDPVEALFVDPFAGVDHPLPAGVRPVPLEVLARLFARAGAEPSRARALLVEEDPVKLDWLLDACGEAGLADRSGRVAAGPAEILLVEGAWEAAASTWAETPAAQAALALVDPPNASRLSLDLLLDLLGRQPSLDLLLRFPASDLRRLAGFRGVPLADLPPYARRSAEGISRLLGDGRHEWAIEWRTRQTEQGDAAAEAAVVDRLAERLRRESGRLVRVVPVPSSAELNHVLLVGAEPAQALLMNEVLFRARGAAWLPWPEEEREFVRYTPRATLELFGGAGSAGAAGDARDRTVDVTALAHSLATRFAGRRLPFRGVLESVLDQDLFVEDVRRALGELRRDGRALFRSLGSADADVAFPRLGATLPQAPARQRRRPGEPEELSLDFQPE